MLSRIALRQRLAGRTRTAAAVLTVSLTIFGLGLLLQRAFDNPSKSETSGVVMLVYMEPEASQDQIDFVQRTLETQPGIISGVEYCNKSCAYNLGLEIKAGDESFLQRWSEDIAPPFFRVVPVNKESSIELEQIGEQIEGVAKVKEVVFPGEIIDVLAQLKGFIGVRTLVFSVVLLFASALLIWNTIRTAMFARRREIEVMKLVGATDWFIRLPFMLEGLLQGVAGGAIASGFIAFLNNDWTRGVKSFPPDAGLTGFIAGGTPWGIMLSMIAVGAVVGAIGSATAASKFLDV